jgi:signal transduction histidine kinase
VVQIPGVGARAMPRGRVSEAGRPGFPRVWRQRGPARAGRMASGQGDARTGGVLNDARIILIATAVISGLATAAFLVLPQLDPINRWPLVRIAIETAGSLVALFAAFLVFGRLRRRAYLNELLLAAAMAVLAISNLLFVTVPTVADWAPDDLTIWSAPLARALGAVLFIAAAFMPRRELRRAGATIWLTAAAVVTVIGLTAILVHEFPAYWAPRFAATFTPQAVAQPALRAHPVLFASQLLVALLYGLAAIGFFNRAKRLGDDFFAWLAGAAILAVVSHINYSLFPASYSQSVLYTGDIFRFAFYAALLLGCLREIWSYWTVLSDVAVHEERRRMARDLHDGLAQELAYISRHLDLVTGEANADTIGRLRPAVERAQLALRQAISALAPLRHQTVEIALAEAVSEIADRAKLDLQMDIVPGLQLPPARAEALVRIACEAVTNAARHSGVKSVTLRLERDGCFARLRVADRGRGFDTAATHGGFGLIAMQERARSVGGELRIHSSPGRGSEVRADV